MAGGALRSQGDGPHLPLQLQSLLPVSRFVPRGEPTETRTLSLALMPSRGELAGCG